MIALAQQKKKFRINFSKGKAKFCLSLHYSGDESYLHANKTEICKFKGIITQVGTFFRKRIKGFYKR